MTRQPNSQIWRQLQSHRRTLRNPAVVTIWQFLLIFPIGRSRQKRVRHRKAKFSFPNAYVQEKWCAAEKNRASTCNRSPARASIFNKLKAPLSQKLNSTQPTSNIRVDVYYPPSQKIRGKRSQATTSQGSWCLWISGYLSSAFPFLSFRAGNTYFQIPAFLSLAHILRLNTFHGPVPIHMNQWKVFSWLPLFESHCSKQGTSEHLYVYH